MRKKKEEDDRGGDNITAPSQSSDRLEAAHVAPSLSERPVPSAEVFVKPTCFFRIKERKADVEPN